jgi:hypothetical protein
MFEFLDYPRQALYNAVEGVSEGDWKKAAPGLIGAGVAAPLIATGVGAPLGILAGSAAGGLAQGLFGQEARTPNDLVKSLGVDPDTSGGQIASFATHVATDPLTYAGIGQAAKMLGGAGEAGASRLSQLLGNRRGFTMLKDVDPGMSTIGRMAGAETSEGIANAAAGRLMNLAEGGTQGLYSSQLNTGASLLGADPAATRHEIIHGIIDQAAKSGSTDKLPILMKIPARLAADGQETGIRAGLAELTDELAAHTLENRGTMGQLRGAAEYLFNHPWNNANRAGYAERLGDISPAVAMLYRAMGYAPHAAVGAGAAGGGYVLGRPLGRD